MKKTIGILVGSLRKNSFNRSVANYVVSLLPAEVEAKFIEIGDVPFYNEDLEATPPQQWLRLRQEIKSVDAVLFFTPEYNRSIPAILKNALDVGSRPYGKSSWSGKAGGVISISPGAIGGFGANHHLRQVISCLNIYSLQQPEAYIGNITAALNESGEVVNPETQAFLKSYVAAFVDWINKF